MLFWRWKDDVSVDRQTTADSAGSQCSGEGNCLEAWSTRCHWAAWWSASSQHPWSADRWAWRPRLCRRGSVVIAFLLYPTCFTTSIHYISFYAFVTRQRFRVVHPSDLFVRLDIYCYRDILWMPWTILIKLMRNIQYPLLMTWLYAGGQRSRSQQAMEVAKASTSTLWG